MAIAIPALISGGSTIFSGAKSVIGGLFGRSGAKERNQKREALSRVGFNLVKTSSKSFGGWNIDDWTDQALDNVAAMYDQYGPIVAKLHNERKLTNQMAENIGRLQSTILNAMDERPETSEPGMMATSAAGGFFSTDKIALAVLPVAVLFGGYFLLNRSKK